MREETEKGKHFPVALSCLKFLAVRQTYSVPKVVDRRDLESIHSVYCYLVVLWASAAHTRVLKESFIFSFFRTAARV